MLYVLLFLGQGRRFGYREELSFFARLPAVLVRICGWLLASRAFVVVDVAVVAVVVLVLMVVMLVVYVCGGGGGGGGGGGV